MDREPVVNDVLRLTAYFGERQRTGGRFVAEEMLDLFTRRGVASSVMLRGIAGYGARQVIRTDQSLSLSEDPPVTIAAVDNTAVIAAVADEVAAMSARGLLTLEPARLADASFDASDDKTVTLTVALGRNRRVGGEPAFSWVCDLLHRHRFAGATAYIGVDGTVDGERRRARFFSRNADVPLVIVAVGTAGQVRAALPVLRQTLQNPLLIVEPTQVCKRDGTLLGRPLIAGPERWLKLTVHTSEATRVDGSPVHRALVRLLRTHRAAAGATVLRGIWGFHGDHPPRGDRLIQLGRQVPVSTVVIDTAENISRSFDLIDRVTGCHGLVTCQAIPSAVNIGDAG